ncbi:MULTISPECIES: hemin ABC transporter substrate-binding protein [Myroides]|uniref:ABC transporter substrate-binding protein n=1 Tax=Myroides albus TaxID=2562892 RepID=A0A6I3LPI7_9FLAO|nr:MULTISPECIES: ABC transporter substrate-binding protein [Myroides]MTG97885.1 ABC transporter substrate-binding protein [Myroides albus]MVX35285.1 ABC transporter substrate-binding protein [Myroides sp. LoEW2-1]UVD81072.1 ABC transporter substrate-binding protein [Myroides albus]
MKKLIALTLLTLVFISCNQKKTEQPQIEERIISLNGTITEILVELGKKDNIVGVDVTSTYPEDIKKTATDLNHTSKISIESLMSLKPTTIFAITKDINEDLKNQIANSGIKLELIDQKYTVQGTKDLVKQIATSLNITDYEHISANIQKDMENLHQFEVAPKVLFIYARGASMLMVAGDETPVNNIIQLAGGQNAITEFKGYKPLTPESLLNTNPDYILMFTSGIQSMGGVDGVLKIEGIDKTNAGKNKNIIAMDGQLLSGYGPRLGQATKELNTLFAKQQ